MLEDEILDSELDDDLDPVDDTTGDTTVNDEPVIAGGNDVTDTPKLGDDTVDDTTPKYEPAMTHDEVVEMNRTHNLQTGVMNPVSEQDKADLGRFASVQYRGNDMGTRNALRTALKEKLRMQECAYQHSKLYSYAF